MNENIAKVEISEELDTQLNDASKVSGLGKADVVRQTLHIGLQKLVARFQPPMPQTRCARKMKAIAEGH